jgi:MFS superfamily sulfate permease-like transporter
MTASSRSFLPHQSFVERVLPIASWARNYRGRDLRADVVAGMTLAAFAVPESLAYATLAGLPPQAGLYAGVPATIVYALLGSSRLLAVGVASALANLTASTIGPLAGGDPRRAAALAAGATLIAGAAALIGWIARLGFLANLVSRSVLTGFSIGAGIYIASTQLGKLFGADAGHGEFCDRIATFLRHVEGFQSWTLGVGLGALAMLVLGSKLLPKLPSALVVVKQSILEQLENARRAIRVLVIDLESSPVLDTSGAGMLAELGAALEARGVALRIAGAHAGPRELLVKVAPDPFASGPLSADLNSAVEGARAELHV